MHNNHNTKFDRNFNDHVDTTLKRHLAPLVLDLDGTLIRSDLLYESMAAYLSTNPLRIFMLFLWLLKGRTVLKRNLAKRVTLDIDTLPVNKEIVTYAEQAKAEGREVYLATATDELFAIQFLKRFSFFSGLVASDGTTNLKGEAKAQILTEMFPQGFIYAGDSFADLAVWRQSSGAILVGTSRSVERQVRKLGEPRKVFGREKQSLALYAKSFRLHQWAKNTLIFIPLILGGKFNDPVAWLYTCTGFLALGIMASATYILNDLFDLKADRAHRTKCNRPLASGRLPIDHGFILAGLGIGLSFLSARPLVPERCLCWEPI